MDMSLSKLWEIGKDREAWCAAVLVVTRAGHDWATEQNSNRSCNITVILLNMGNATVGFDHGVWHLSYSQPLGDVIVYNLYGQWLGSKTEDKEAHSMCGVRAQSCPTLCDPVDCSPPGSSVHGVLQARRLEWVAMPSSTGSSWPRDWTCVSKVSCIGRQALNY